MTKNNIITFPKTNIRENKLKDIAKELEIQMTKIKEQRELVDEQKKYIMESILDDEK
jgi:cell division protein ZapA (FtsZ GTPase activity inhibitor)